MLNLDQRDNTRGKAFALHSANSVQSLTMHTFLASQILSASAPSGVIPDHLAQRQE